MIIHPIKSVIFLVSMLFLFLIQPVNGQEIQFKRTHPISLNSDVNSTTPVIGSLDVVAVMVEFQSDTNRLTSGTGIFGVNGLDGLPYLTREVQTYIDPLPHNQAYFQTHLEFVKNYFLKSSDDQLLINYQVLPQVYQLDKQMAEYSPIGETFTLEKIADLMQDVWTEVEAQGGFDATGLDPNNTAFVIFHAGIGRDVVLTGTSLDITPFDLPSISLNDGNLAELLGDPTFAGFSINNGAFLVNNSMLIPRTQSRRGTDISDNEIVFPLSINGLLSASIGSFLGLPDLFNTENGQPAIGRFGLMDGAGIFAYNGLLPPEPSAWEKVFLGWETPFLVSPDEVNPIQLPAASLDQPNSIAKIELSSTEYFLVENRHRDPELLTETDANMTITTRTADGSLVDKTFTNLDEDFIFQAAGFDTMLTPGTIVDVSNFDWSLPGGIDVGNDGDIGTEDDRHLNGGILIWHIDEGVLARQLDNDRVNADENRRGVDLEEGDGAQDIGKNVGLLDNSPTFGYAFDFWWASNDYRVITRTTEIDLNPENRFGSETYPNNNSNSGAKSYFELFEFSENQPVASFRIRSSGTDDLGFQLLTFENSVAANTSTPRDNYWAYFPLSLDILQTVNDTLLVIPTADSIFVLNISDPSNLIALDASSNLQPIVTDEIFSASFNNQKNGLTVKNWTINSGLSETLDWSVSTALNQNRNAFISSVDDGATIDIDFTNRFLDSQTGLITEDQNKPDFISEDGSAKINGNVIEFEDSNLPDILATSENRIFIGDITDNQNDLLYLFEDGKFIMIDPSKEEPFKLIFEEEKADWPAIVDEGHIYRINRTESSIEGYQINGAQLSNTPILSPDSIQFIGTPIIADITGDNRQDILVVGQDEYSVNIFAFEKDGNSIAGFPLYIGGAVGKEIQPIHPVMYDDVLYAISHTGDLRAWRFLNHTSTQWPGRYGENPFNKVSAYIEFSDLNGSSFSVLNKSETYNWPNPANEETNLRFQLESAGSVKITIIDLTGRVIYENEIQSNGGSPEEITLSTNEWGSGAYFAQVEAEVNGRKASKMIKIAVAH